MTAGKARRLKALPGWEAWLGDNDRPARAPRLAGDLDAILATGPKPADWGRSRRALQRKLQAALSAPVYYARINRSPVGALWVAVGERGLMGVECDEPGAGFVAGRALPARAGAPCRAFVPPQPRLPSRETLQPPRLPCRHESSSSPSHPRIRCKAW